MGAKERCKMHLPGYFSLRDINNNANAGNANWPLLQHQDGNSRQYCDLFRASSTLDFDLGKEQLRQTILKHETLFQHQLHELHRLYNTQRDMMNGITRNEKPVELSVGDFAFCFPSENRRNEWWCSGSNSMQSMTRFKNGEGVDDSKFKKIRRRLFDIEVPADRYLDGDNEFLEVPVDSCQQFLVSHENGGDASGSGLKSTRKSCTIDLNESLPDIETTPQRFNPHMEISGSLRGSFPCKPKNGCNEHEGSAFPRIFHDKHREMPYKSPHGEHGKLYRNCTECCGKKKIFGVEISGTNPSSNGCLKILGFSVLENHREPQDLPSSSCSPSKSGSPASVLFCGANSGKVESLTADHMFPKSEEKQLVNGFSISPASVLSYGSNSSKVESLNADHMFQKSGVNQSISGFSRSKYLFDLNSYAEEGEEEEEREEVRMVPSSPRNGSKKLEIDLEAPASNDPETSGAECESPGNKPEDESLRREEDSTVLAAEALLSISLSCINGSGVNPDLLSWFADVISSHEVRSVSKGKDTIPEEMDYFECMTLKQPETAVEECNRDNENPIARNIGWKQPRRGRPRRGRRRQRKDFQRDVLPTLTSLSRKEAIDDLRAIGDLIRDAGEKMESGSTPTGETGSGSARMGKNGSGRGRKRSVCGETGFGERSLVGWGKRTRRPPRQRCMNAPPVIASK